MDNVDLRYKDNIREALQFKDVSRLMELVPSLTEERACQCIDEWKLNYLETMSRIRNSQDTSKWGW